MSQRTLRQKPRISYYEPEEPNLDEYIYCEKCYDFVYEYCSIHGPLAVIPDDKVPTNHNYPSYVPRAALTIPKVFLHINYSSIPGAGLGVFTTLTLPRGVRLGPYAGDVTDRVDSLYCWQIYDRNNKPLHAVDARSPERSNWMRYVNCARHWREQNLVAFQYRGQLYYRTIKIIPRYTELLVFYGGEYARRLGIDLRLYNSPKGYAQKFGAPVPKKRKIAENKSPEQDRIVLKSTDLKDKGNQNEAEATDLTKENASSNNITEKRKTEFQKGKIIEETSFANQHTTPKGTTPENFETNVDKVRPKGTKTGNFEKIIEETSFANQHTTPKGTTPESFEKNVDKVRSKGTKTGNIEKTVVKVTTKGKKTASKTETKDNTEAGDKLHQNVQNAYFYCNTCNYQTVTKNSLDRHMMLHDEKRTYQCETCGYRFPYKRELKIHLLKHASMKPFACNICSYRCTQAIYLKTHIKTHTGEKPFACNICSYRCTQATSLNIHIKTHTGEKPFACNVCSYRCTQAINLKTHIKTHTGEKPFACNICSYRCTQAAHLKKHIKTHTGEKPFA